MTGKEQLISWLNDAYAMEKGQHKILQNHIDDAKDFVDFRSQLEEHAQGIDAQCERLQECIESLGGKVSGAKSASVSFMGTLQNLTAGLGHHDKLVKNIMAGIAAEHYEMAMYKTIKTAAIELGYGEIAEMCDDSIRDEKDMADYLREQLPSAVTVVVQEAAGVEARPETTRRDSVRPETARPETERTQRAEPAFGERIEDEEEDVY